MPFSPDELSQIRDIVRSEVNQRRSGSRIVLTAAVILGGVVLAVLLVHVILIAGFTIWHLRHR